eukprot:jgi/Botrbrau1/6086/Bobra.177_1s0024.1
MCILGGGGVPPAHEIILAEQGKVWHGRATLLVAKGGAKGRALMKASTRQIKWMKASTSTVAWSERGATVADLEEQEELKLHFSTARGDRDEFVVFMSPEGQC